MPNCQCGNSITGANEVENFCSEGCKVGFLLYSAVYSRVIAYIQLEEKEKVKGGDRIFNTHAGFIIWKKSEKVGKRKEEVFDTGTKIYRPLVLLSLLSEDLGKRKVYLVDKYY